LAREKEWKIWKNLSIREIIKYEKDKRELKGGLINHWRGSRQIQLDSALMVLLGRYPTWDRKITIGSGMPSN